MLKNCISIAGTAALVFLSTALSAAAADLTPDNPASKEFLQRTNANRSRIEAMAKEAGVSSDIHFFAVPPMSEIMRRAEVFPEDGWYNECLRAAAAQDEYEPVSFQLFSYTDKKDVSVTVSDLKSKDGFSIPAKNLDLKVVKIWYQNGNGWNSYFSDVGLRLVPELLLKDENMVKVDTEKVANYARIRKDGKDSYVWISAPRGLEPGFNAVQKGFEDAEVMQNVSLEKNQFKQFFVTIHVPENQNPGVYSGTITVHADKSGAVSLPLKVRVLPFRLPAPATYQKLDMPVICSCMGWYGLSRFRQLYGDEKTAMRKYREMLANGKAHGLIHPTMDQTEESIGIMKEMGFSTDLIFGKSYMPWYGRNFGGRLTFDNMMQAKEAAEKCKEFYMRTIGHTDGVLVGYGDEQGAAFVTTHRNFHKYFEQYNIRVGCAGHSPLFYKGAHLYGFHPMGGDPDAKERISRWKAMGDKYIGFYASQHTGSENPAYIRRQNGMLGYMNGLNMLYNYEFAYGPWNDLDTEVYKPMAVAYLNYGGMVDTLQWEGYREAVDDMRYATLLQQEIQKGLTSGDVEYKTEARKALLYLASLKPENMDLDAVRSEMIVYILKLRNMTPKKG